MNKQCPKCRRIWAPKRHACLNKECRAETLRPIDARAQAIYAAIRAVRLSNGKAVA